MDSSTQRASDGHCVLVGAAGGGAGASSIAAALAVYLGQQEPRRRRICLVDFDLVNPSLAMLTGTRPPAASALDGEVGQLLLSVPALGIGLFCPLAWPPETGRLTRGTVARVLRTLAASHDVVIIDGGRLTWAAAGIQRAVVDAASQIVLVAEPALSSVSGLAWSRELLCGRLGFGVPATHVGVVWNKVRRDLGLDLAAVAGRVELAALQHFPDTGDVHTRAVNAGEFPSLLHWHPDWAARIHLLVEVLFGTGVVEAISGEVADLLPALHRDGQLRTATRVRRSLLGRLAATPTTAPAPVRGRPARPVWA